MESVSFQNDGLIDPRCISTIGVSVKEGENPIGFFGTGLKYAIAIVLRLGGSLTIWRGLEPLRFTKSEVMIRGQVQRVICMNGAELGFTDHLGKHWEPWQAFRELWCNTSDEGGVATHGAAAPREGATTIVVESDEFAQCLRDLDRYILPGSPIAVGSKVEFFRDPSPAVFYRRVNVGKLYAKPCRFAINITEKITLTEDRSVKNQYEAMFAIAASVVRCDSPEFLEDWLTSSSDWAEHEIDLDWTGLLPGPAFLEVVRRIARDTSRPLNVTALKVLAKHAPLPDIIEAPLLDWEREAIEKAVEFCRALTYTVDEYPIQIVESLGEGVLGMANLSTRKVLLARRAIQMGDLTLAATLIEEWAHLKHGHKDCSREMQNWLFEQVTRLGFAFRRAAA